MTPLYPWQEKQLATHGREAKWGLFASPRLGKTRECVEEMLLSMPPRAVVVCPLVVTSVWEAALAEYGIPTVNLYSGALRERAERLKERYGVALVNWDALDPLYEPIRAWKPAALVGDESHLIKSPSAKRARSFRKLAWCTEWVRLLTGTPTPNHLGDFWGQLVSLNPDDWGRSYEKYARRYLIRDSMFPSKVLGFRNTGELMQRVAKYASIIRREDVFGPDTWQFVTRRVALPPSARRVYDSLRKHWHAELEDGALTVNHRLTQITRLQQVAAGYVPNDRGEVQDLHRAKVDAVLGDLEEIIEAGEKAVLFHRFRWEGETYAREVGRIADTARISGDTPPLDRADIVRSMASSDGHRVAVVQLQSGGVGISFAAEQHALFTSRGFSYTDDTQARDRIYAPGARRVVTYYEAIDTVDTAIAQVLAGKRSVAEAVASGEVPEGLRDYANV